MPNHPVAKSVTPGSRVLSGPVNNNYTSINDDTIAHIEGTDFRHLSDAIDVSVRDETVAIASGADDAFTVLSMYARLFSAIYGPMVNGGGTPQTGYANRAVNQIANGNLYQLRIDLNAIMAAGGVSSAMIAANAITSAKIADGTIATGDLADGAVTSAKIADGTIVTGDIADGAITSTKLADGTVNAADLAARSITAAKIALDTITAAEIAADAITASELAALSVGTSKLVDGAVTTVKIGDAQVTAAKIATDAITATQIAPNAITASELADNAVDTAAIADGAITAAKHAADSITAAQIAPNAIGASELADGAVDTAAVADGAITSLKIADGTIATGDIAADAITSALIASGAVGTSELADQAVATAKMADYAVSALKILEGAITPKNPLSLSVHVNNIRKWNDNGQPVEWVGGDLDLSGLVPTSPGTKRYTIIAVNSVGLAYATGGDVTGGTPVKPSRAPDTTPLGFVYQEYGQTFIDATMIYPWRGPGDGTLSGAGVGSSPVGHAHGLGSEARVTEQGLDALYARPTVTPSMSILVQPGLYRDTSGKVQRYPGGTIGPFTAPSANPRYDGVYLDRATGAVAVHSGPENAAPVKPSFTGQERSIAYIRWPTTATVIKASDDTANAWIDDARTEAVGVNAVPVAVSEGGTGTLSFTAGLLKTAGGTAAFTTVTAPSGAVVGTTDAQVLSAKTLSQANAAAVGTVAKAAASPTASLWEWQDSAAVVFGNVSQFKTFGMGAAEATGSRRVYVAGSIAGSASNKFARGIEVASTLTPFDNTAFSVGILNGSIHAAAGGASETAQGIASAPTRAGGDTGSFIEAAAFTATAPSFATNNYAYRGTGDVAVTGVTAFPTTGLVDGQTCYRSDLNCLFRYMTTGTVWRQMGIPAFTTAARPAAPPTDFRYFDLTDRFTYRWTGAAYVKTVASMLQLNYNLAAATSWNGTLIAAATATSFQATQSFTVEDGNSLIEIAAMVAVLMSNASGTVGQPVVYITINSVNYVAAELYQLTGTTAYMRGAFTRYITLAAGSYTAQMWFLSDQAETVFCQPNIDALRYQSTMQVIEHKP